MIVAVALIAGYLLDLAFGDPHGGIPSPVVLMGKLIAALEGPLRRVLPDSPAGQRAAGAILVVVVCLVSFGIPFVLLWLASLIHPLVVLALQIFWCYQVLAMRCLRDESMKVHDALADGDLDEARTRVSYLVGRDTEVLDERGVTKAAVETIAENTADGEVAPMFWFAVGGAPLALLYKAINTMDSMIGYRNDRYRWFGTVAARLDDVANWIPARLAALFMICSAKPARLDARGAWRIWRRDRRNHASPNSAQTESVCAGALGVQLAGNAQYFGKMVEKKTIGDDTRAIEVTDIARANHLMYLTGTLCLMICCGSRIAVCLCLGII